MLLCVAGQQRLTSLSLLSGLAMIFVARSLPAWEVRTGLPAEEKSVVIFTSMRSGNGDLYAVPLDGGSPRRVVSSEIAEGGARHDPSRNRIVWQRIGDSTVTLMSQKGEVFKDPNGDAAPVWSIDGKWVAYSAIRGDQEDLYIAKADGSNERRLTNDPRPDRYPVWSPDSQSIAFARKLESGWDLHQISIGEPEKVLRLTSRGEYLGHLSWSPDGECIAFDTSFGQDTEIAIYRASSKEVERITRRPGHDQVPSWSLDGKYLLFGGVDPVSGNWDILRVEVSSGELKRLTTHPSFDGAPVVVPGSLVSE